MAQAAPGRAATATRASSWPRRTSGRTPGIIAAGAAPGGRPSSTTVGGSSREQRHVAFGVGRIVDDEDRVLDLDDNRGAPGGVQHSAIGPVVDLVLVEDARVEVVA